MYCEQRSHARVLSAARATAFGRVSGLEEPMFLAADGVRPYTYSAFSSDFSSACVAHGGAPEDKRRLYPMLVPHPVLKDD